MYVTRNVAGLKQVNWLKCAITFHSFTKLSTDIKTILYNIASKRDKHDGDDDDISVNMRYGPDAFGSLQAIAIDSNVSTVVTSQSTAGTYDYLSKNIDE
jgi:hypothetical protein